MPTTVTATDGTVYHLFQLDCSVKDYAENLTYTTIENELSDGYWSQTLFGSNTGVRKFSLQMPTIPDSGTVTGPNGETLTKRAYLRALHAHTIVDGLPFVIISQETGQYYLVRIADPSLTLQRMLTKLYSTGLELKQVRIPGISVFNADLLSGIQGWFDETSHNAPNWEDITSTPDHLTVVNDVTFGTATQNGLDIVRLNATTNDGRLVQ